MKIKKAIFSMLVIMAILLCACIEIKSNVSAPHLANNFEANGNREDDEPGLISCWSSSTIIRDVEDGDFRKAIINEVNRAELMREEQYINDDNYRAVNNISDIKEFYYPSFKIDGYELYTVLIMDALFTFRYVPIEYVDKEFSIWDVDFIEIAIRRPEWWRDVAGRPDPFQSDLEQAQNERWGYLTEDNMLYAKKFSSVVARMGDTTVRIDVPESLNTYEFLRDLAFQVIRTSEKVDVQYELDVMRQRGELETIEDINREAAKRREEVYIDTEPYNPAESD